MLNNKRRKWCSHRELRGSNDPRVFECEHEHTDFDSDKQHKYTVI